MTLHTQNNKNTIILQSLNLFTICVLQSSILCEHYKYNLVKVYVQIVNCENIYYVFSFFTLYSL